MDQRCRRRRRAGQPGAVQRPRHDLRQRSRRAAVGAARRARRAEMVGCAAAANPKWSVPLKFLAQTPPSVRPSGLIVSGGGPDTRLVAFKDAGDHAQQVWRRNDVSPLSTSSLAGQGVGYVVVTGGPGEGARGMSLLVFDPGTGHTLSNYPL